MKKREHTELLPHLFRQEYAKMTAVLCRHFGLRHIELAEDIASSTFLKASETWALQGIPENPTGWLYTVAKNKARDHLRHVSVFESRVKKTLQREPPAPEIPFEINEKIISDSQLAMIFAVCNPVNSPESQVALALQILCGFSVQEIARAFLSETETIKKRLLRARNKLRTNPFQIHNLGPEDIQSRMDNVMQTLYLLFNEGYFSQSDQAFIRQDLCAEALRLLYALTGNPLTNTSQTQALLALFCYQSSRLPARTDKGGAPVLFDEQDRTKWDAGLIEKGNQFLVQASQGTAISKYHLEAGIAYWHTTENPAKWKHILDLFDQLTVLDSSPITALNRTFAYAKVFGSEQAIPEVKKLKLIGNAHYHAMLGYLYSRNQPSKAIAQYEQALTHSNSKAEQRTFSSVIDGLKKQQPE